MSTPTKQAARYLVRDDGAIYDFTESRAAKPNFKPYNPLEEQGSIKAPEPLEERHVRVASKPRKEW